MKQIGFEVFVLWSSGLLLKKLLLVTHSHLLKKKKSFKSGCSANTVKCCVPISKGNFSRQKLALSRETTHFAVTCIHSKCLCLEQQLPPLPFPSPKEIKVLTANNPVGIVRKRFVFVCSFPDMKHFPQPETENKRESGLICL